MYAKVVVEYPVKSLDKCFTYEVPENLQSLIKVGMKVVVPFKNQVINGIVVEIVNDAPEFVPKQIAYIENSDIYLNEEQMQLAKFIQEKTLCPLIQAYQTMLPSALKIKNQKHNYDKYDVYLALNQDENTINKYIIANPRREKQIEALDILAKGPVLKKEFSPLVSKALLSLSLVKEIKKERYRINVESKRAVKISLNDEQKKAYDSVNLYAYKTYLLEGVTGSGKTEVYMALIDDVIKLNKTAIVLVPEICLTTQTVQRFYDRFGQNVAIFHSGLTPGEKYDEYKKIYAGEVKIVVGTRSSIFVPLQNLGIIIIDEEHSETYKQDVSPRYDAKQVAEYRAKYHNIPLILASATPLLETKARASKKVYELLTLTKRANNMVLPQISLVDMTQKTSDDFLSNKLKEKILDRLSHKEQIILLLNRRGFSTFITCDACGYTYKCPNCDITLTFHKTSNNLRCHYCGYYIQKGNLCPECHSDRLTYKGLGTEKVEEKLRTEFKEAKIIRMDQDTTTKKGSYQKIIDDFASNKYDILLGTQMISKGLDFKNVTLVGIINADTSLNIPDFRANEKTFSLLYQTSGRCGRHEKKGEVIIQTFNPDNPVLNMVKENDFQKFYLYEMDIRHKLKYPPYTYIALIMIKSKDYALASKTATNVRKMLDGNLADSTIIYGPTTASIFRINNVYHFQVTIKYTYDDNLPKVLKNIDNYYALDNKVNIDITFNPSRF